jgi:hypothetical protein
MHEDSIASDGIPDAPRIVLSLNRRHADVVLNLVAKEG